MAQLIPLSRLARLVGKPRALLQKMAQSGELVTFDGHVALDEVLRHFPDIALSDDSELLRVEDIKHKAVAKAPERLEIPDHAVLNERLNVLGRDFAAAQGRLLHYERVHGWIVEKLAEASEQGRIQAPYAREFTAWLKSELAAPPPGLSRWEDLVARERVLRVMSAQVTVLPKGQTFEVLGDQTLLEAGLAAGLALPYGCANGSCGDCTCRVVSGDVLRVRPHDFVLSAAQKAQGMTLACSYTAVGDLTIEVEGAGLEDIPEQTISTRVRAIEPLGGRRVAVHLLTARTERLRFLAGQWLEITVDGRTSRVPAASCPCDERRIEVHVRCETEEAVGTGPFSALKPNTEVWLRGPFGRFVLDDASTRPIVLLAQGAGFAQIKSLLQHALSLEQAPSIALYRLADGEGPYQQNLLKSYAGALDHFRYVLLEAPAAPSALLDSLAREQAGLSGHDVYACGNDDFIASAESRCRALGLPAERWRAECVV
ncbi:MAG: 2Fe-2S iron-sulfur cluster-binding protein [Hyphomicrobiaceae bacterium]|nr:2Fe-2S iron-sulfur cluster-binding protein [Hyphomicrobiaceae bacterium]